MEENSSFHEQLREKITLRGVMNKKTRMLEADIDKNSEKSK